MPTGPFDSTETGTGYRIKSVLIGYCMQSGGGIAVQKRPIGALAGRDAEGHCWGVLAVECSISGKFLKHLPKCTPKEPPTRPPPAEDLAETKPAVAAAAAGTRWCLAKLVTNNDEDERQPKSIQVTVFDEELAVSGHVRAADGAAASKCTREARIEMVMHADDAEPPPAADGDEEAANGDDWSLSVYGELKGHLRVDGWQPASEAGFEVAIMLHGWTATVESQAEILGQLFAMGGFPPHIKPLLYGWPSGLKIPPWYMEAARSSESEAVHNDFRVFLEGLRAAGIAKVHILAHSMGGRLLCSSFASVKHLFAPVATKRRASTGAPEGTSKGMQLASVILLHPETGLDEFVASQFAEFRERCSNICLFADTSDEALIAAQEVVYKYGCIQAISGGEGRPSGVCQPCSKLCQKTHFPNFRSLGLHPNELCTPEGQPLDMDVVDISWMEHNVAERHNYFTKNFWMVSDIRDILVSGRRARLRSQRLIARHGNVFSFIAAPPNVS